MKDPELARGRYLNSVERLSPVNQSKAGKARMDGVNGWWGLGETFLEPCMKFTFEGEAPCDLELISLGFNSSSAILIIVHQITVSGKTRLIKGAPIPAEAFMQVNDFAGMPLGHKDTFDIEIENVSSVMIRVNAWCKIVT